MCKNDHGWDPPSWHLQHKRKWHIQMQFTHKTASFHAQSVSVAWGHPMHKPLTEECSQHTSHIPRTVMTYSWPEPTTRAVTFCSGTCHKISARSTPLANDPPRKVKQKLQMFVIVKKKMLHNPQSRHFFCLCLGQVVESGALSLGAFAQAHLPKCICPTIDFFCCTAAPNYSAAQLLGGEMWVIGRPTYCL